MVDTNERRREQQQQQQKQPGSPPTDNKTQEGDSKNTTKPPNNGNSDIEVVHYCLFVMAVILLAVGCAAYDHNRALNVAKAEIASLRTQLAETRRGMDQMKSDFKITSQQQKEVNRESEFAPYPDWSILTRPLYRAEEDLKYGALPLPIFRDNEMDGHRCVDFNDPYLFDNPRREVVLKNGDSICSPLRNYRLTMQDDCNIVLYGPRNNALSASHTCFSPNLSKPKTNDVCKLTFRRGRFESGAEIPGTLCFDGPAVNERMPLDEWVKEIRSCVEFIDHHYPTPSTPPPRLLLSDTTGTLIVVSTNREGTRIEKTVKLPKYNL
jgi:hypothetical protein